VEVDGRIVLDRVISCEVAAARPQRIWLEPLRRHVLGEELED